MKRAHEISLKWSIIFHLLCWGSFLSPQVSDKTRVMFNKKDNLCPFSPFLLRSESIGRFYQETLSNSHIDLAFFWFPTDCHKSGSRCRENVTKKATTKTLKLRLSLCKEKIIAFCVLTTLQSHFVPFRMSAIFYETSKKSLNEFTKK